MKKLLVGLVVAGVMMLAPACTQRADSAVPEAKVINAYAVTRDYTIYTYQAPTGEIITTQQTSNSHILLSIYNGNKLIYMRGGN